MVQQQPIFVAGPDRSGTSLTFALLASHPSISMVRRTNMWRWFYNQFGELTQPDNFERCLSTMLRYKRLHHLKPDPDRIRREFWQGKPTYGRLFALFHEHNAERVGKPRWGDKSLHTEHYADQVLAEFPNAKIIHMIRDPRDRFASVLKRYDGKERGVASTTGRWLSSSRMAKHNRRRYPDNYKVVCYETLAHQPEQTLHEICTFIDEEYSPLMLTMGGAPEHGERGGNSSFGQFEPGTISTRSIGRYRQVISKREIAFIQAQAGEEMTGFGYQLDPIQLTFPDNPLYYLVDLPMNLVRMTGWLVLKKIRDKKGNPVPTHRLTHHAQ
jgi:hypothetical protein